MNNQNQEIIYLNDNKTLEITEERKDDNQNNETHETKKSRSTKESRDREQLSREQFRNSLTKKTVNYNALNIIPELHLDTRSETTNTFINKKTSFQPKLRKVSSKNPYLEAKKFDNKKLSSKTSAVRQIQEYIKNDSKRKSHDWKAATSIANEIIKRKKSVDGLDKKFKTKQSLRQHYLEEMNEKKEKNKAKNDIQAGIIGKFILYLVSNFFNILTVIIYILQTMIDPDNNQDHVYFNQVLIILELSFSFYFLLEFFIFFYISKNKCNFIFSLDTVVDVITIFPSIITFFLKRDGNTVNINLTFFRIFRIFRVFRILRIYKTLRVIQSESSNDDTPVFKINPIKFQMFNLGMLLIIILFIGAGICLGMQEMVDNAFNVKKMNFIDAFYFMIVTCTTMGYGDIVPKRAWSRLLVIFIIIILFFMFSDQVTKLTNLMNLLGDGLKSYDGEKHIILILDKTIKLENFLWELKSNPENNDCDVLVLSPDIENLNSKEPPYNKVIFMRVGHIDFETLDQINIISSKAIFIFCNKSLMDCAIKEKVNELFLLQVNQFNINPENIYIQSLYFDHNTDARKKTLADMIVKNIRSSGLELNKNKRKSVEDPDENQEIRNVFFKKMIPIFKIKNKIIAKSIVNPGFATFIQNLLFNKFDSPINVNELTPVMKNYYNGCENKIFIRPTPKCFIKKTFMFLVKEIYLRSINDFFTKINVTGNDSAYRPILPIGIIERGENKIFLEFFPIDLEITEDSEIIFISYNNSKEKQYLEKFLKTLEEVKFDGPKLKRKKSIDEEQLRSAGSIISVDSSKEEEKSEESLSRLDEMKRNRVSLRRLKTLNTAAFGKIKNVNLNENNFAETLKAIQEMDMKKLNEKEIEEKINKEEELKKYTNANTYYNLLLIKEADENFNSNELKKKMDLYSEKYFSDILVERQILEDYQTKKRIHDLEKDNTCRKLENHILIMGYQDNLVNLLKYLTYSFKSKKICILSSENNEAKIIKLMKQFPNLLFLKGEAINPYNQINAGIHTAFYSIYLTETIDRHADEDLNNLLGFRTQDYCFDTNAIIELWDSYSIKQLGYVPISEANLQGNENEFANPLFMAGKVVYINQLEKIIASSYNEPECIESWLGILNCGYNIIEKYEDKGDKKPLIITIDVPKDYYDQEYITLVKDLLDLDTLSLGLYLPFPTDYFKLKSEGKVVMDDNKISKVVTSHKSMYSKGAKVVYGDNNYFEILKENSYNDKAVLDYVDVDRSPLPIFITNPEPGFILLEGVKVMVLFPNNIKKRVATKSSVRVRKRDNKIEERAREMNERKKMFDLYIEQLQRIFDNRLNKAEKKNKKPKVKALI